MIQTSRRKPPTVCAVNRCHIQRGCRSQNTNPRLLTFTVRGDRHCSFSHEMTQVGNHGMRKRNPRLNGRSEHPLSFSVHQTNVTFPVCHITMTTSSGGCCIGIYLVNVPIIKIYFKISSSQPSVIKYTIHIYITRRIFKGWLTHTLVRSCVIP